MNTAITEEELNKTENEVEQDLEEYINEAYPGLACEDQFWAERLKELLINMSASSIMNRLKEKKLERLLE